MLLQDKLKKNIKDFYECDLYLLSLDPNFSKICQKDYKQLFQKCNDFASKCYKYYLKNKFLEDILEKYKYHIIWNNKDLMQKNYLIKASVNLNKKEITIYKKNIEYILNIINFKKVITDLETLEKIAIIHECFHIIENEVYKNKLVKQNKIKSKLLGFNKFYKINMLSEISAIYFCMKVLNLNVHLQNLDFILLENLNK